MNLYVVVLPAKVLADGTHKIRIAISHNNETRYKVTRFKVPSPRYVRNGKVVCKYVDAEYINKQLNGMMQTMYRIYDEIKDAECYTCSQLLTLIETKIANKRPVTFDDIAAEWLAHKERMCSKGSMDIYRRAVECFVEFFGKGFLLSSFSASHVLAYDTYLLESNAMKKDRSKYSNLLSPSTINIRMRTVRSIIKYARERNYVDYEIDPFIGYAERKENIRDIFLPVEVLRRVRDVMLNDESQVVCRDIFMLSFYLCGLNLEDMVAIDFRGNEISFIRGKTKSRRKDNVKTVFTIQPEARAIIDKYIGDDGLLHFSNKRSKHSIANYLDKNLKKIAEAVGYDKRFIYYCARKSFAQYANELNIQERIIDYCLGHTIKKEMIAYYITTSKKMADDAIRKVLDFVASDKTEHDLL